MARFTDDEIALSKDIASKFEGPGTFDGVSTEITLLLSGEKQYETEQTRGAMEFTLALAIFIIASVKLAVEYRKLYQTPPENFKEKAKEAAGDEACSELTDDNQESIIRQVIEAVFESL